ncbi:23S rRNA (adenine2503-C2)-methyltransferase [Aequitasia blattaphilus]|uniref:Probable dual-specificity RNA methyltransferase RlmN n=1 Tax=Aequitasia blattaphilus TaxID=2949332 RepID=A0ABT1EE42_9FIRM|nr:23S rRNA (adenine(2503)-C(2))-methyltransferase RlmN [Aequitasia blattaphilus]MCP1102742.1 23S rRNA (adenine(2503)-C(2))-methyltransferase RlmN [Aequitasia blattaphilus]MCR8615382.1 23S rRNA (adenine(2503)-C(2))-methyltransferase RlmN [Aequitasia blattaphilus]
MTKIDICSYNLEELIQELKNIGEKSFRGKQIYEWLHIKLVSDFDEMTNLSKDLRNKLKESYQICKMKKVAQQISKKDGTRKYLFELEDKNVIESVLMSYDYGNSICISSQVGCKMGCRFCASTIGGLKRNLRTSEMLRQIYEVQKELGERISNVVIMGTGEPMDNYDNFVKFVRMISDSNGLCISQRNITVSTCGLVPEMKKLSKEGFQITLALSLHGATQEKRKELMPIANQYSIDEVLSACENYFKVTGRRVSLEYSLVKGVNDTEESARDLIRLIGGKGYHLNLIPVNPVKERQYEKPDPKNALAFKNKLEKNGINVTIRRERGSDIDGACGQLRHRFLADEEDDNK